MICLDRANDTFHTTALQAGDVALKTNAKRLLIGHFSARYKTLTELLDEAKSVFPATELAIEGRTVLY
jgi:ribonuclease Z